MRLTREGREERILDLYYNQNKTYRQIAKEARVCPRDIKRILDKDVQGVQGELSMSVSSKAYKLFSEGKSPLEVAIALNLRADEVIEFYKECWYLKQLYDLNQIYLQTKGNIAPVVMLYKSMKAAGMNTEHVIKLLQVANSDLPRLEHRYQILEQEVKTLEYEKRNSGRVFQDLSNQVAALGKTFDSYCLSCQEEGAKLNDLKQKRIKLEGLVRQFENNNSEYIKIRKTAEEKVLTTLSHRKGILRLALLCLTQSMRNDPEKYNSLIRYDGSSTEGYTHPYYSGSYMYRQQNYKSKNYSSEDYMAMVAEEADKLWNMLPKELVDKIITDYSTTSGTSLPSSSPPDEE